MLQNSIAVDLQEVWNRAVWPELTPSPVSVAVTSQKFPKLADNILVQNNSDLAIEFGTTGTVTLGPGEIGEVAWAAQIFAYPAGGGDPLGTFPIPEGFEGLIVYTAATNNFNLTETEAAMGDILTVLTANPLATTKYRSIGFQEQADAVWIDENLASVWVEFVLPVPDLMALSGPELNSYAIPQRFRNYLSLRAAAMLLAMDSQGASAAAMLALAETAMSAQLQRLPPPPDWRQVRTRTGFGRS